jgi:iron complex outermembrane recepter protein
MSRMAAMLRFCLAFAATAAFAQETVVVTATRLPQPGFDIPAAIDAVNAPAIREDNPQVNLSETLNRVPGIVVQNRQNYAQDLQVSSRGFGARSTFGVRGVRLIADGIPATMPDGQGQAATFDLSSADRIEVLRGPFASLYGNSSGGVVQVFTADGPQRTTADATLSGGSFGQRRANVRLGGQEGSLNYLASASRFESEGYRDHSAVVRDQVNAKLRAGLGAGTMTFIVSGMSQPDTQDPLGLARAQLDADPRQVDPAALAFDTRKTIRQAQAGAVYEVDPTASDSLHARLYFGERRVIQYLGQSGDTPLGSGGVVDLDRGYGGIGLRWSRRIELGGRALSLSLGADHDKLAERRRGYVNDAGRRGALRRDEDDGVSNSDLYAQAEWFLHPRWVLSGGARRSTVRFESDDFYVTGANPDDSGRVSYARTTPVLGVLFKASRDWNLYANAGEGFETPTFAELAYRPGGATGLNLALRASKSRHAEAGFKGRWGEALRVEGAAFRIETRDEIVTNASSGGRTDFRNAGRTVREGFELAMRGRLGAGLEAMLAYTALDARFTEAFTSGGTVVPAGRRLPGVPPVVLHAQIAWRPAGGFHAAIEARHSGKVYVNEANGDAAAAYTVANVRVGYEHLLGDWRLREFVRVDNVADRRYAGSVIVAEARGRFFEPAPGRNVFAGVEISRAF